MIRILDPTRTPGGPKSKGKPGRRGRGRYHLRLEKRGVTSASVRMTDLETLRKRARQVPSDEQARRAEVARRAAGRRVPTQVNRGLIQEG